ncbi:neuropeptide FF receptor 2 [Elysia marginata]|uniref:Neuropeptide FF receptor 2 n=1 Tax=Elysia marginata TaxID=1093978 RepID=A0AAV4GI91_9GAST|nr:neuropeptide FF receptor 2 [Elysia marginata]
MNSQVYSGTDSDTQFGLSDIGSYKKNQTTFVIIQPDVAAADEGFKDAWNYSSEYAVAACGLNCSGLGNLYTDQDNSSSAPSTNVTEEYFKLVKQPLFMLVILSVSYGIVFLLALLGNISVIIVVARDKSLHTATNLFLVNMAVADMLMAIFCLPLTLLSNIYTGK